MLNHKKILLFLFWICCSSIFSIHQPPEKLSDESKISVLTCYPWEKELYSLYGHTALRVEDPKNDVDLVFNYGIFDFNSPLFLYRFVKGETDYMLGVERFEDFLEGYGPRGIRVVEQKIALSPSEKEQIWKFLLWNIRPENRVYRYNFLYNNCATVPRDIIEKNLTGRVVYPNAENGSFRDLIHDCLTMFPWSRFGIDLLLGTEADRQATTRESMFLPARMKHALDSAKIINSGDKSSKPLVEGEVVLFKGKKQNKEIGETSFSPLTVTIILFVFTFFLSISQILLKSMSIWYRLFDLLLYGTVGIMGVVLSFMMFFSVHPAIRPNWNIVWLNFIHLIFIPFYFKQNRWKVLLFYHFINFVFLSLFLLSMPFIPQYFSIPVILIILSMVIRSFSESYCLDRWLKANKTAEVC